MTTPTDELEPNELDLEQQFGQGAPRDLLGVQYGAADSADFIEGTWSFKMHGDWQVVAGEFAIMPRAAYAALAAQAAPSEQAIKAERRAIEYSDIVHKQVVAMRAAVVAAKLESPDVGIQWIANTLFGPGHYPDIEAARELGGAQALFDKEAAELEAFRAAHPAPVAVQSPAQAVPQNCGTGHCSCIECMAPGGVPPAGGDAPIDMVLFCPKCGAQHIDAPDSIEESTRKVFTNDASLPWANPPHRSHLCHGCGHIWRPADVPTNGVKFTKTQGKNDSPVVSPAMKTPVQR